MTENSEDTSPPDIRKWLSVRVQTLAWELNRQMTALVRNHFDLTLPEWRIIAHLAARSDVSVQTLAGLTGMDKAQASRTVTSLALSNMITREDDPSDGRAVLVRLTDKGQALYEQIAPISAARREWLNTLADKDDLETFLRVADTLIDALEDVPNLTPTDWNPDGSA